MKYRLIILLLLFLQCNPVKQTTVDKRTMEINKNYMFCLCMGEMYIKYKTNFSVMDGSAEIYFINDTLAIDIEQGREFVKNYLDSIDENNLYRSYNNNSLAIAKCLDFYNSKELEKFVIKKINQ